VTEPFVYLMTEGEQPVGAIFQSDEAGSGPIVYMATDDIDVTIAKVRDAGGSADDKQPIPQTGWLARCKDTGGGSEGSGVGGMSVDDRADVRAGAVDAGVEYRLEVEDGVRVVERDDVLRLDLVERHSLALDPDLALGSPDADVPERQVRVALGREDAAGAGHLLAEALGHDDHQATISAARSAGSPDAESRRP
jgi:hypothetical protein